MEAKVLKAQLFSEFRVGIFLSIATPSGASAIHYKKPRQTHKSEKQSIWQAKDSAMFRWYKWGLPSAFSVYRYGMTKIQDGGQILWN